MNERERERDGPMGVSRADSILRQAGGQTGKSKRNIPITHYYSRYRDGKWLQNVQSHCNTGVRPCTLTRQAHQSCTRKPLFLKECPSASRLSARPSDTRHPIRQDSHDSCILAKKVLKGKLRINPDWEDRRISELHVYYIEMPAA